jgi:hypothetical protein
VVLAFNWSWGELLEAPETQLHGMHEVAHRCFNLISKALYPRRMCTCW